MKRLVYILLTVVILSCSDDENNIPTVEERVSEAINALKSDLTAPSDGWRLDYQPTDDSGIFLMLLNFNEDGTVLIKSDIADNNGEFVEHTISYRLDNALSLELILETYGVFHYLFEQDQSTFGAEFEFNFVTKEGSDLIFQSKSDQGNPTVLTFRHATPQDESLLSIEEAGNFNAYDAATPQIFGGTSPIQQIVLEDHNLSVFWSIDISKRRVDVDLVATGITVDEVIANNDLTILNHSTGYALQEGKILFLDPINFNHSGNDFTIEEILLSNFGLSGDPLCAGQDNTPVYQGQITSIGDVTILQSLLDSEGFTFQPMADQPYSVNILFVFDENANSLFEGGIIESKFPNATGFAFNYGFESDVQPSNAVGLFIEDENGTGQTYLREFEETTTEGNSIRITFTNNFYYSNTPGPNDEQSLTEITDLIFEGEEIYIYDLPVDGLKVFRLYNPCNRYEFFLVQ